MSILSRGAPVRRITVVATMLGAALVAACGGSSGGDGPTTPSTPVGSYGLSTVNGRNLPARILADTGFSVDIADGSLAVQADGKFVIGLTSRWTVDGNPSVFVNADTGTWQATGGRLVLTYADSTTQTATWQGDRITMADSSGLVATTFLFARR